MRYMLRPCLYCSKFMRNCQLPRTVTAQKCAAAQAHKRKYPFARETPATNMILIMTSIRPVMHIYWVFKTT